MIIYKDHNFIFQHINRCGGVSVRAVAYNIAGRGDPLSIYSSHRTMKHMLNTFKINDLDMSHCKIYINIRNPFGRIVSIYSYRMMRRDKDKTFRDFFYEELLKTRSIGNLPISEFVLDKNGQVPDNTNFIMFGQMDTEWPKIIKEHFGVTVNEWPHLNLSMHNYNTMEFFDKEMIDIVLDREKWVIENFFKDLPDKVRK